MKHYTMNWPDLNWECKKDQANGVVKQKVTKLSQWNREIYCLSVWSVSDWCFFSSNCSFALFCFVVSCYRSSSTVFKNAEERILLVSVLVRIVDVGRIGWWTLKIDWLCPNVLFNSVIFFLSYYFRFEWRILSCSCLFYSISRRRTWCTFKTQKQKIL